jgi:lactoylglutathione lyase
MFQRAFPILSTTDMERALRFYRDLLGGVVSYQFPPEGEPGYVALELGGSHLGIGLDPSLRDEGPPDRRRFALWVDADDCDAAVEQLRGQSVTVLTEPADQPWGERVAEVLDPDGHKVIIASRP